MLALGFVSLRLVVDTEEAVLLFEDGFAGFGFLNV